MKLSLPTIQGTIARRLLVNFRANATAVRRLLPHPFEPLLVEGYAVVGICLIRLEQIRPRHMPSAVGVASENAAHRIAVRWNDGDTSREGVFIPRRDTDSRWNVLLGGRLFPGVHHHAHFDVEEADPSYSITVVSEDEGELLHVDGQRSDTPPETSLFKSLPAASAFFRNGCTGYSPNPSHCCYEGLELRTNHWSIEPIRITTVRSAYFSDRALFPDGSIELDSAFLMRGIPHEWHELPNIAMQSGSVPISSSQ